jgi:4-alpha-glucanotransferase
MLLNNNYIEELSSLLGIIPEYYDIKGNLHRTSLETRMAILSALGIDPTSQVSLETEIERRRFEPWLKIIEPVHVLSVSEKPFRIPLYLPLEDNSDKRVSVNISIQDEKGRRDEFLLLCEHIAEEKTIQSKRYVRIDFILPDSLDLGYYDIDLILNHYEKDLDGLRKKTRLIIAPDSAYLPEDSRKILGLSINLYSLRSRRNWGVGDFGDLKRLSRSLASSGCNLIGINPLHALSNTIPFGISPYSPLSRLYKNFIYIDITEVEDLKGYRPRRDMIQKLRQSRLIDYEAISKIKLEALRTGFRSFMSIHYDRGTDRDRDFRRFLHNEGRSLLLFSTYMALSERFGSPDWQSWPQEYREPDSEAVKSFIRKEESSVLFHQYLQWLIELQHKGIKQDGTPGLYHDLAIGAIRGSSDVWSNKPLYALNMDVGAPPDDFSPDGQNWGFPPLIPERLRENGYELFIQTLRKNMMHAEAIRIDHALGIFRLFWIPTGMKPENGAYIRYPHEDLLRIIALESVRNRTIVIAEDLGTIGENVRENLRRFKMLSYRLFYFERNYPDPSFLPPSGYPELSLAAVTTHDLPTLYGYWIGRDIEERKRLGKYPDDETWKRETLERQRDKMLIIDALKKEGLIAQDFQLPSEMTEELCLAIYRYLIKTPSRILLLSLDDIIGRIDQQNMPGVTDGYPNWRQKMDPSLEDLIKRDSGLIKFIHCLVNSLTDDKKD